MCFMLATNWFFQERKSLTKRTAAAKQEARGEKARGRNLKKAPSLGFSPEVKKQNKTKITFGLCRGWLI